MSTLTVIKGKILDKPTSTGQPEITSMLEVRTVFAIVASVLSASVCQYGNESGHVPLVKLTLQQERHKRSGIAGAQGPLSESGKVRAGNSLLVSHRYFFSFG